MHSQISQVQLSVHLEKWVGACKGLALISLKSPGIMGCPDS